MTFSEKLRELRQTAGLSEADLAARSGVSFGAVHNYGLGYRAPTFAAVVRLARALGVTCEAFAECEDIADVESLRGKPAKPLPDEPRPRGRPAKAPPADEGEQGEGNKTKLETGKTKLDATKGKGKRKGA